MDGYTERLLTDIQRYHTQLVATPRWRLMRRTRLNRAWLGKVGELQQAEVDRAGPGWKIETRPHRTPD